MKELIAALLLTFIFPVAGFSKITNFNATALGMKNMTKLKYFPNILFKLAIFGAILIEFISPLIIVGNIFNYTSNYLAKLSVIVLIIFTILATLIFLSCLEGRNGLTIAHVSELLVRCFITRGVIWTSFGCFVCICMVGNLCYVYVPPLFKGLFRLVSAGLCCF